MGSALSLSNPLIEALYKRSAALRGLTIVGSADDKNDAIFSPKYSDCFKIVSVNTLHTVTPSKAGGHPSPTGAQYYDIICQVFELNTIALRLSPPDADGYCRVDEQASELTKAVVGFDGITKRIAMLDLSLPIAGAEDTRSKVRLADFDLVCGYF